MCGRHGICPQAAAASSGIFNRPRVAGNFRSRDILPPTQSLRTARTRRRPSLHITDPRERADMEVVMLNGKVESVVGRVSYFLMPLVFIALLPLGLIFHAPWVGIFVGAVVIPILDELVGRRDAPLAGPTLMEVRGMLVVLLAVIGWSLFQVVKLDGWLPVVLAGVSSGYILGAVGIPAAHELGHRRLWLDKLLGQFQLACIGYG